MCIGIPMKVIETDGFFAICEGRGRREGVNMMLVGPQEVGAWVLVQLGSAREVLTEEDTTRINDALDAVEATLRGEPVDIDRYFPDLAQPGAGSTRH